MSKKDRITSKPWLSPARRGNSDPEESEKDVEQPMATDSAEAEDCVRVFVVHDVILCRHEA